MDSVFYKFYVYTLIILKLFFIVTLLLLKFQNDPSDTLVIYNDISKNIVMGMLAILMIYLFHPKTYSPVQIGGETKLLMFLFGILALLDIPWFYPFNMLDGIGISQKTFSNIMTILITIIVTIIVIFLPRNI